MCVVCGSRCIVDILWAQLLLQFFANCFEILQAFLWWSEDLHVLFQKFETICSLFSHLYYRLFFQTLILQKCIRSRYLVGTTPHTVLGQLFRNFTSVLTVVWKYACAFFWSVKLFTFFAGTLSAQLHLQLLANWFETLRMQVLCSGIWN